MGLYSRVELSGAMAKIIYSGSTARIDHLFRQSDDISRRHAKDAMETVGDRTVHALEMLSPIGKGNPGTLAHGGFTPPRMPGTLKSSWRSDSRVIGDDVVAVVWSTDPVSEYVDKGTGLHAAGGGGEKIRGNPWLAVPSKHLVIGGSRKKGSKGKKRMDVRFLKSTRGQSAQHFVSRAQRLVRPTLGPTLRNHARMAKMEIVARLKGI